MIIALGSDHAAYELKEAIKKYLENIKNGIRENIIHSIPLYLLYFILEIFKGQ